MTQKSQFDQAKEIILYAPYIRRHAQVFFFDAMKEGYAADSEPGTLLQVPGSKTQEYSEGPWRLLDTYLVTPLGDQSGGTTFIWYDDIPIWMMQYIGSYSKEALFCLKIALMENYGKNIFLGGRGPETLLYEGYLYLNQVQQNEFYGHTYGREMIISPQGSICGMHRYQAQWLVSGGIW